MTPKLTVVSARVPTTLAGRLEALARRRRVTVSLLLRRLVERELDADAGEEPGPIEATTRARIEELLDPEALDPRAVVACELARRLDVDPSNGAQHSRELMRLLEDVERSVRSESVDPLDELRARTLLRRGGYGITRPSGEALAHPDPERAAQVALNYALGAGRPTRRREEDQ